MVKSFKFFHGVIGGKLTAVWTEDLPSAVDAVEELTRLMSDQIAEEIDREILERLINETNEDLERTSSYLNYWLGIGGNRA